MPRAKRRTSDALDRFASGAGARPFLASLDASGGEDPGRAVPIPLDQLVACPWQPRAYMAPERLEQLVASIRQQGLLQAITVRRLSGTRGPGSLPQYQIVAGHRRVEAFRRLFTESGDERFATILAVVRELDDVEARLVTYAENLREEPNKWEKARSVAAIRDVLRDANGSVDIKTVAEKAHISEGAASEYTRIADAVTIDLLNEAGITIGGATDFATVQRLSMTGLLAVAKRPREERAEAMRKLVAKSERPRAARPRATSAGSSNPSADARPSRYTAEGLREDGGFNLKVLTGFKHLSPSQALSHLNDLVVGGGAFAEAAFGTQPVTVVSQGSMIAAFVRPFERGGATEELVLRQLIEKLTALVDRINAPVDEAAGTLEEV